MKANVGNGVRSGLRVPQSGFTLIELVVTIVVLAAAVMGVYSASSEISRRSADPLLRTQALAIAQTYMEEIQVKEFAPLTSCPIVPGAGDRSQYSHICHYAPWTDHVVKNQFGVNIPAFSQYSVDITISQNAQLGPAGSTVPVTDALLITVTVDHAANPTGGVLAKLSGYRTNY